MHDIIYLNDQFVKSEKAQVSILDRGFLFSDGIYEVVAIHDGHLILMNEHIKRLNNSLDELQIKPPKINWLAVCNELIVRNRIESDAILYIQVTRGSSDTRNHIISGDETPTLLCFTQSIALPTINDLSVGFKAIVEEDIRWAKCHIKSTSLLPNILLKNKARDRGAIECILHRNGIVTEGSASNVFMVKSGEIRTPEKSQYILPGITRDYLIEIIKKEGLLLKEGPIHIDELKDADEIWITSTTRDLTPIVEMNGSTISNGLPGPIWRKLTELYQKATRR